jgi:hypothetical protein
MNDYQANGYYSVKHVGKPKEYYGAVAWGVRSHGRGLRKPCRTASEAIAYVKRVIARYEQLVKTMEAMAE